MRSSYSAYGKQYNVDTLFTYAGLLTVSLFYWVIGYIYSIGYPVYSEVSATPLWDTVCNYLPNKTITYLIGILLMTGGAFLIFRANYILVIIREKTFLPPLLYILLISTNPSFFPFKSTSLGIFCLILAIYQLFVAYHDDKSVGKAYNSALFIGIGSLLWIHILWFLPLFWLGMFNFKSLSIRTFLASLLGIITVYWFLLAWCVLRQDFSAFTIPFASLTKIGFFESVGPKLIDWIIIIYIGLFVLIASINIFTHEHEENIRTRQYLYFLIIFFVVSFSLFFVYEQSSDEFFCISCIPASILISHFFTVKKGKKKYIFFYTATFIFVLLTFVRLWNSSLNIVI